MHSALLASGLAALSSAQQQDCVYRVGFSPIELDLYALKGQILTYYSSDNSEWAYSPCQSRFACAHNGVAQQSMVDHSPDGVNECFPWASYDASVQPFYDGALGSFIFNYSNGEACPQAAQVNRSTNIIWTCDVNDATPRFADAFEYDECNVFLELKWSGACFAPPPPNEECEFKSGLLGGPLLNLSSVKGQEFSLRQTNGAGHAYTYDFTPCANGITCDSAQSAHSAQVMADVRDEGGQCAKFLGVWSGDSQPFYDRTVFGQDYWDFFWMNGEECGAGGPLEVLNVRYYCNPQVPTLNITRAYENGPCQFRIDIDSNLACKNASEVKAAYA